MADAVDLDDGEVDQEVAAVRFQVNAFLEDAAAKERQLPKNFNLEQRKLARRLAGEHALKATTWQDPDGTNYVVLERPPLTVAVAFLSGKTFDVQFHPSDTIKELKSKIKDVSGMRVDRLLFGTTPLLDNSSLEHYDINDGATLHACMLTNFHITLEAKSLLTTYQVMTGCDIWMDEVSWEWSEGRRDFKFDVEVSGSDTVHGLEQILRDKTRLAGAVWGGVRKVELSCEGVTLDASRTLDECNITVDSTVVLRIKDELLVEDIGVFGVHSDSAGINMLMEPSLMAQSSDARAIAAAVVDKLGGDASAGYTSLPRPGSLLSCEACKQLVRLASSRHEAVGYPHGDFKLQLSLDELTATVGSAALSRLTSFFDARIDEIKLRRVEAHEQCINFHLDVSEKTLQVPLNSEDEYTGGRLVYLTDHGVECPPRPVGSATLHGNRVVHGVTKLLNGVRYSLFFLKKP